LLAWKVTCMNRLWYSEEPLYNEPILTGSGQGWNALCMHHIDAYRVPKLGSDSTGDQEWLAFVDGCP